MTYLFSNPQIKKWKTLFFLSFLLNVVFAVTFAIREREVRESADKKNDEVQPVESASRELKEELTNESVEVQKSKEVQEEKKDFIKGEPIKSSVIIEENFFSAFSLSEHVAQLAAETSISALADLLSAHIGRLLMWDLVLRNDVRKGDRIDFVFRVIPDEEKKKREDLPDLIEIIAVSYNSKKFNKEIEIFSFFPEKSEYKKFYYKDGTTIEKFLSPFAPIKKYIQVTSLLADRAPKHEGADFKAVVGTPVYATVEGTVSRKNWMTKYNGYCIEIEERSKPFVFKYLHLSEVLVDTGQKLKPGDHIGNSGNSGKTTAPHLHYQINIGLKGNAVDPFNHHKTTIEKLSGSDYEKFRNIVVELDSLMNK